MTHRTLARVICSKAACLVAIAGLSPAALADLPGVLDRVPADAPAVIAIRDMEASTGKFTKMFESLGLPAPAGEASPVAVIEKLLGTAGLNKHGSVAAIVVAFPEVKAGGEPSTVILAPISDFAGFVKALGAEKTEGQVTVKFDGKEGFAKDVGGGYAALTTSAGVLEKFDGKGGMNAQHTKTLGKNGASVCDTSDVILIANIPQLQSQLKDMQEKMKSQMETMAAMAGEQGSAMNRSSEAAQTILNTLREDGSAALIGFTLADKGMAVDLTLQFKEGSKSAGMFTASGKASKLLAKIPNLPFYFAGAADLSTPGARTLIKAAADMQAAGLKDAELANAKTGMMNMLGANDKISGMSFVMGANPAAMMGGGLFVNTVTYTATSDSKEVLAAMAAASKAMDGQKSGPATTKTTYKSEDAEIAGTKIDKWTSTMEFDPNDPMAAQTQMMTGMILGQGGLSGMNAAIDGGIVSTMSQNTPLMTSALDAAKSGKGSLSEDTLLKDAQANLPANRTIELYIGVKALMDAGVGAMAMFGGGPEIKVPAQLSPIALGGTTENGGMSMRVFVPTDVMKGIADVMKQAKADDDADADAGNDAKKPKGDKPPRF
jgi:hypothetical protein